jgi:hypothetical protein
MTCYACHGTGQVREDIQTDYWGYKRCPTCHGRGILAEDSTSSGGWGFWIALVAILGLTIFFLVSTGLLEAMTRRI